jgi:hypothetical protein
VVQVGHLSLVFKDRPSTGMSAMRPLPAGRPQRGRSAFGSELPPSERVPSMPFLPTSTVYSAFAPCGFVAPRNRPWGSPRFGLRTVPPTCRIRGLGPSPVARHPSELFPRPQPYCVTTAVAFSPLSCSSVPGFQTLPLDFHLRQFSPDLKALLHGQVRCREKAFPPERGPMLPWA